jgi:hypothetical protein
VTDRNGRLVATYAPATYKTVEDGERLHVHKLGAWDLEASQELEPERTDDRRRGRDLDYPSNEPPENEEDDARPRHRRTHDTRDDRHMAALRALNKRNRALVGVADSSPMPGFPRVRENPNPQQQQNGLKALNRKHRKHYGR